MHLDRSPEATRERIERYARLRIQGLNNEQAAHWLDVAPRTGWRYSALIDWQNGETRLTDEQWALVVNRLSRPAKETIKAPVDDDRLTDAERHAEGERYVKSLRDLGVR